MEEVSPPGPGLDIPALIKHLITTSWPEIDVLQLDK